MLPPAGISGGRGGCRGLDKCAPTGLSGRMVFSLRIMMKSLIACVILLGSHTWASGGYSNEWARMREITPRSYVCERAKKPLKIDGRLDEAAWARVPWTDDFADIEGPGKARPQFRTRAKMLWDDTYFYVGAEIEEPHVWATLTNHDAVIFYNPDFEVFIDPNGDNHDYFEIEINALNTEWDLRLVKPYKDGGPALNEWEIPGLKTAVHVDGTINAPGDRDRGWTVEFAFPWKSMASVAGRGVRPSEGDRWRVNFSRVEWKIRTDDGSYTRLPSTPEDNWVWSPTGIIDMHRPERWGFVEFTRKTGKRAIYHPDPSLPIRDRLMEVYYAQRAFFAANERWAGTLKELGVSENSRELTVVIRLTSDGYEATVPTGDLKPWHIRQDSLLWQ